MASLSTPVTLRVELQQQIPQAEISQNPIRVRLTHVPASVMEVQQVLQNELTQRLAASNGMEQLSVELDMTIEIYDQTQQQFVPFETLTQLGRNSRLSVSFADADALFPDHACLALPSRMYGFSIAADETFMINGREVKIREVGNSGKGTGLTTWDGSVVLAKYLEHKRRADIAGSRVVELGAGTGLAGISAALLGARQVLLSDLDYVVENLANNVHETLKLAASSGRPVESDISTLVLDWFSPPTDLGDIDFLLASDVVWVEELIPPLVATFDTLLRHSAVKTQILLSYQKRSVMSDRLLFSLLQRYNLVKTRVRTSDLHPAFRSSLIDVCILERNEGERSHEKAMVE
ncbi:hypothetical protein PsorP6_016952 [Peronosclerospora sorghi]|uniref:Uncharacterized protein n=1 Tax=Peronosclerospora sorghi TaxID=230839 RepID=A0ACC0WBE4_9STRA|nr:hypothetical protein PsorP6_016952 [Peronosclerospora sorghi]